MSPIDHRPPRDHHFPETLTALRANEKSVRLRPYHPLLAARRAGEKLGRETRNSASPPRLSVDFLLFTRCYPQQTDTCPLHQFLSRPPVSDRSKRAKGGSKGAMKITTRA